MKTVEEPENIAVDQSVRALTNQLDLIQPKAREILLKGDAIARDNFDLIKTYFSSKATGYLTAVEDIRWVPQFHVKTEAREGYEADGNTKCPGRYYHAIWVCYFDDRPTEAEMNMTYFSAYHGHLTNAVMFEAATWVHHRKTGERHVSGTHAGFHVFGGNSEMKSNNTRVWYSTNQLFFKYRGSKAMKEMARAIKLIEDHRYPVDIEAELLKL